MNNNKKEVIMHKEKCENQQDKKERKNERKNIWDKGIRNNSKRKQ
jgi:hypothetical protein